MEPPLPAASLCRSSFASFACLASATCVSCLGEGVPWLARRKFCAQNNRRRKQNKHAKTSAKKVKLAENRSAPSRSRSRSPAFFDRSRHFLRNISSKCVPGVTFNIKGGCRPKPTGAVCCGRWAWRAASTYKLALLLRHFVVRIKQPRAEKVYKMKEKAGDGRRQCDKCRRKRKGIVREKKTPRQEKKRRL